jgi:hypothetical protein
LISEFEFAAARSNLWNAQRRFKSAPHLYISIDDQFAFSFAEPLSCCYTLDDKNRIQIDRPPLDYAKVKEGSADDWATLGHVENVLFCYMEPDLLRDILYRKVHWNNAEIGCLIRFDRRPNVYMPDVHTLLSYFHLPRPKDG